MDTSKELATLIKYSPKRETMLGDLKDNTERETCDGEEKVLGIVKFCPTRWTVKATCYQRILDNYASKSLQSKRLSATTGQNLARLTVNALESLRNDESFNSFYDVILVKVKEHPSVSEPILPRK